MAHPLPIVVLALTAFVSVLPGRAKSQPLTDYDSYSIMRPEPGSKRAAQPEPWLPPKYKSPRGTRQHVVSPQRVPEPPSRAFVPPPLYVPQTGQVLPNLPSVSGAGPGGRETSQDRAMRCVNQAGVYGARAGDRNSYVNSCVNQ
jgi:hypothetical protein